MLKNKKSCFTLITIAIIVFILDQLSKYAIRMTLTLGEIMTPFESIGSFFRIIHWKNTGVSFGLFPGIGWLFSALGLLVVILVIIFYKPILNGPAFWRVALGMQLGGAIGNLADRLNPSVGYVVDFIWIGSFPVFNIADIAVVAGAGIMIAGMWFTNDNPENINQESLKELKND